MEDEAFSSVDFVGQCLQDEEKATAFDKVLKKVIKQDHHVLDIGTGSGILALIAARAGAKKITALEFDAFIAKIARKNFENNGYRPTIEVVTTDARSISFPEGTMFDVVIMEMLTSGMVDEFQVQATNNLHRHGYVGPSTIFVPYKQETYATLANIDYTLHGFRMEMVLHAWRYFRNLKKYECSKPLLLNSIDFSSIVDETFEATMHLQIEKGGIVNALWLSSKAYVDKKVILENTMSLNPPVIIPIPERRVARGDKLTLQVAYKFGGGYKNFKVKILQ